MEERINKAMYEAEKSPVSVDEVLEIVNRGIKEAAIRVKKGYPKKIYFENLNYVDMPSVRAGKREYKSVIFVQFTNSGHVAVVGAGSDSSQTYRTKTGIILKHLQKAKNDIEAFSWKNELIFIPIEGLESVGVNKKKGKEVLKSRNGVEQYIGDYLIKNNVPILNFYSHRNSSITLAE